LFFDIELLFDRRDANFELPAFVDFMLFELGELRVEAIYPVRLDRRVDFGVELVDATIKARLDCGEVVFRSLVFDFVVLCLTTWASISPSSLSVVFFAAICAKFTLELGK
jgi:hypothetical protein